MTTLNIHTNWLRSQCEATLENSKVNTAIIGVIIANALILGLNTSPTITQAFGGSLEILDKACLTIFTIEIALKLFAYGPRFFRSGWNIFDALIVTISLVPGLSGLSVLRALRILRTLRAVSSAPSLRRVVEGLISALPGMASVFALMSIIFYIAAVMATSLFGSSFPDWFGSIGASLYSLFQIMTLESWSMGIVRPVLTVYPYAWAFFVPFIIVTTFAVANLIVGLVVNSMQSATDKTAEPDAQLIEILQKLNQLETTMEKIHASRTTTSTN